MASEHTTSPLREQSFVGARLPAASLGGTDLRGADFTGADLHDADLTRIRSGMSRGWTTLVVSAAFVLSVGIGLVAGICSRHLRAMYTSDERRLRLAAWFVTAMLLVFIAVGIGKGLRFASRTVLPGGTALAILIAIVAVATGSGTGSGALVAVIFLAFVALVVALSVLARAVAATAGRAAFTLVAVAGGLAGAIVGGGLGAAAIAIGAMLMAHRSAKLEAEHSLMDRTIAAIASRRGTRFCNANLAGANLEDAQLIACDFRGADLTGARFNRATMRACRLDRAGTRNPHDPTKDRRGTAGGAASAS
jgi:hypothetical protein